MQHADLLHRFGVVERVHGFGDLAVDLGPHLGFVGEVRERGGVDAVRLRPHRRDLTVEHDERAHERTLVADHARLTDQRLRLQCRLEVGG